MGSEALRDGLRIRGGRFAVGRGVVEVREGELGEVASKSRAGRGEVEGKSGFGLVGGVGSGWSRAEAAKAAKAGKD